MGYLDFVRKEVQPHLPTIFGDIFEKRDPEEFRENGSQIYHGMQGRGKTLSMVYHSSKLKKRYPKLLTVANIHLRDLESVRVNTEHDLLAIMESEAFKAREWQKTHYIYYQSHDALLILLRKARNDKYGVHFMIDEIHQYFHSHDSKSMPVWVVQIFSQQRKQYLLVTGTVQVWENVIKALREQIQNLIACNRFGWILTQTVVDPLDFENDYGERVAPVKKRGFFFMTKNIRESYDTRQLVESGREIFGGNEMNMKVSVTEPQKNGRLHATRARR